MSLPPASDHDRPPEDREPGWHEHPQHPTVQRYWDGAAWTGEHRFALTAPGDEAVARILGASDGHAPAADYSGVPSEGALCLAAAFGVPLLYGAGAMMVAEGIDDCSADTEANWVLVIGVFMWVGTVVAAERGLRLLGVRMWLRAIVVAVSGLWSAGVVYYSLIFISLSALCFGC